MTRAWYFTRITGLLTLAVIALTASCGALSTLLTSDTDTPVAPTCVVRYAPLGPGVDLGLDDCDNFWIRDRGSAPGDTTCAILGPEGHMVAIPCPAEGDTLGD